MSHWTNIRKKLFGHSHNSGPAVVAAPEAQMQTVEQNKALTAMKQQTGMLSTLLGGQRSFAMDRLGTNAYAFTGKEKVNDKASVLSDIVGVRSGIKGVIDRRKNEITQNKAETVDATATQATKTTKANDTVTSLKKNKKQQSTSDFLGV